MSDKKAYFSPRAVKANEDAIRKLFTPQPGDDANALARCRIGQRVGPSARGKNGEHQKDSKT